MSNAPAIKTTRTVYPQIYAYVIPEYPRNEGWIKIGYTERRDVDERIRQQTQTAGLEYDKLWSGPAKFHNSDEWFGDKQLHAFLRKFKKVEQRAKTEWFYYDGYPQRARTDFEEFRHQQLSQADRQLDYQLRAEQEAAVQATLAYATAHPGGEFLWNAKPRFGKTLTAYDLARRMNAQNVLIVTNRPAIAHSWFDDFETFIAHQTNYRFVSTSDTLRNHPVLTREQFIAQSPTTPEGELYGCIAFISLQDLKGALDFGGYYNKLRWVAKLNWNLLVIDEAHEGVDTFKADIAFDHIKRDFTLHLSGTPFKAVASGRFAEAQIYNWTYADEQEAKAQWPAASEEHNPYENLPRLNLFSYQMSRMITDEVNQGAQIDGEDMDFAFDLNEFFATNNSGKFTHEPEVLKWLDTLTRNTKYPFSTPALRAELKHTFWLLDRVASAKALAAVLKTHPVFENYHVILAAGDGRSHEDDQTINQRALIRVRQALREHERTITLSVGQLTTGVTVPEWTAVLMLSNVQSPSRYMQAAFRSQNQWSYDLKGKKQRKENAYVFDFAPERTLTIYDDFANNLSRKTAAGGGTTDEREANIRTLLNFFPVIAEDSEGRMTALDVRQVLTIPKAIKAREVVRRGFMSNLLFQNIDRIFASPAARDILEQLNPVAPGKVVPGTTSQPIDTRQVQVDAHGNATINPEVVVATTDARFGAKIYADIANSAAQAADDSSSELTRTVTRQFTDNLLDAAKEIARENSVTMAQAQQVVKNNAELLAREVETVKKQAEIRDNQAAVILKKEIADALDDPRAVAEAQERYQAAQAQSAAQLERELKTKVQEKTAELTQKTTAEILQRGEEKKKTTVEDDIRARLRGFARTIPSFLMAYGENSTTLANFDQHITDSVFKEVTGITLDQFRALRDEHNFFDPVVFDESVQEFLNKCRELADYLDQSRAEDIFDYIPPQRTNQIFTPRWVVKMMIDKLEEENPGLFSDPDKTFADLYVKSGLYLTEIVKRLHAGLAEAIPDPDARLKHILENQVFGFAPREIIHRIAQNFIFGNFTEIDTANLQLHDLTETAKNGEPLAMKFDVVVGNPPYQEEAVGTSTMDMPIYPCFYELAEQLSDKYVLISPARFLFNAGGTNRRWNEKMLEDKHLRVVHYDQKSGNIFALTDIPGGIAVVMRDAEKDFGAIETFTVFPELNSINVKVSKRTTITLDKIIANRGQYRFSDAIYKDYPLDMKRVSDRRISTNAFTNLPSLFTDEKPNDGLDYIQIFGRIGKERGHKWFKRTYLSEPSTFLKYKVILPKSNGSGAIGEVQSTPLIGDPLVEKPFVGFTETFISIGAFDNEVEAKNCLRYIKSKFARTMLGILKVTQDNPREKWAKVPLQDFTSESDIDWTRSIPEIDQQLYKKYGLNEKEIDFIETKIKPME